MNNHSHIPTQKPKNSHYIEETHSFSNFAQQNRSIYTTDLCKCNKVRKKDKKVEKTIEKFEKTTIMILVNEIYISQMLAHTISTSEVWQCKKLSTIKLASWYLYQRSHRYGNSKKDCKIYRNGRSLADNDTGTISVKNKSCKSLLTLIIVTANM